MKALVYTGLKELEHRHAPDPIARPDHSIIRVESVGICGSDMHAYLGHDARRPPPLILGHEAAGIGVSGAFEGVRVTVNPLIGCGSCRDCREGRENICSTRELISIPPREGAFAEFVLVPDRNLIEVPEGIPMDHAALAEPLAVGWHAVKLARRMLITPLSEARSLVLGGGAIGVGSAASLRDFGARDIVVVEPNAQRRAFIANKTEFPTTEAGCGESEWELVIDAVGSEESRAEACRLVRQGGFIIHVGLHSGSGGLDVRRMTLQEIGFHGTYTYTMEDFREAADALFTGRLGTLNWIDVRPLAEGQQAFEDMLSGSASAPKIVLKP